MISLSKTKLIYVGDPMCSWCYGISDELNDVKDHYGDLPFEMVMGGLRPYNQQTMLDLKSFLTHHWEDVAKASGQEFNYQILNDNQTTYDTEPPCRASVVVRKMDSQKEYRFFKEMQKAFYLENKNLHKSSSYKEIIESLNLDYDEFEKHFSSSEMKARVKLDFEKSGSLGVSSFPTLLLEHNGKIHIIAQGFSTTEKMIARIDKIRN